MTMVNRVRRRGGSAPAGTALGLVLCAVVVGVAVLGPWAAPHDPLEIMSRSYQTATTQHLLGTDGLGRDVLSRLLSGGWGLLSLAAAATATAYLLGVPVGCTAALSGKRIWRGYIRGLDLILALPPMLILLLLAAARGAGAVSVVTAVIIAHIPGVTRITYAAASEVVGRDFIQAARLRGFSLPRIVVVEILPNIARSLAADIGVRLTLSILIITAANFLGLGLQPPNPDWGVMMSENRVGLADNPFAVLAPAAMLVAVAVGISLLADGLAHRLGRREQSIGTEK